MKNRESDQSNKRKGTFTGPLRTFLNYHLFNRKNRDYTVYRDPSLYEEATLSWFSRRDNLARGVADVVEASIPQNESINVLELGAGTGILSLELARRGFSVTALDLHSEALDTLKIKKEEANLGTNISTISANMNERFPFTDNSFNVIVSLRATRYIEDFNQWLEESLRVLSPGGIFILPVFAIDTFAWRRHSIKGFHQETSTRKMKNVVRAKGFEIDENASRKYNKVVELGRGRRDVPFYYNPTFIVARKPK